MRFIQSTNKDNIEIINLEQVQLLAFEQDSILFFFCQSNSIWQYKNREEYEADVKNIKNHLNNDLSAKEII